MTEPDLDAPTACPECGATLAACTAQMATDDGACCGPCGLGQVIHRPAGVDPDGVREPGTELAPVDGLQSALMAAAEAGGTGGMATVPEPTEFAHLCQMARLLSMSQLAPEKLRGKPFDTLLILLTARDLGIPVTSGLRKISVIEGQPSIDTELQLALVRQRGYGAVLPLGENFSQEVPLYAGAVAVGPNGHPMGPPALFTWDDAQMAGYVDMECRPDAHHVRQVTKGSGDRKRTVQGCLCKDNWRTVPRDMLWWRAAARARRIYFPEATTGMYDSDELGGVIDVEGRLVDPTSVDLPEGFDDPQAQRQAAQAKADAPADPAALWALQERIRALPPDIRKQMAEAWKSNERIRGCPARLLPERLLKLARSMLTGWEADATRAGDKSWNRDRAREQVREEIAYHLFAELIPALWAPAIPAPLAAVPDEPEPEPAEADPADESEPATAAQEPQEPSEPDPGPEGAPEPPEAESDEPGPQGEAVEDEPVPEEPDRDWDPELRQASGELARLVKEAAPYVADTIGQNIKGMSWQAVDKALAADGLSTEGPIDLRRMRLAIQRHMQHEEPF